MGKHVIWLDYWLTDESKTLLYWSAKQANCLCFNEISIFGAAEAEFCYLFITCIRGLLHRWLGVDCCSL